MNFLEAYELNKSYIPSTYYVITSVKQNGGEENPVHKEILGRKAYIVHLSVGDRGFIKYLPVNDTRYHALATSNVLSFSSWKNGEETVVIRTENSEYVLTRYHEG